MRGRCVLDLCAASVDPDGCCYPALRAEDLDGTWEGTNGDGGGMRFTVAGGRVPFIEFDWAIAECDFFLSDEVRAISGHSRFDLPQGDEEPLSIDTFADTAELWSSSLTDPAGLLFYVDGTFSSARAGTITVDARTWCIQCDLDPEYDCNGRSALEFGVRRL